MVNYLESEEFQQTDWNSWRYDLANLSNFSTSQSWSYLHEYPSVWGDFLTKMIVKTSSSRINYFQSDWTWIGDARFLNVFFLVIFWDIRLILTSKFSFFTAFLFIISFFTTWQYIFISLTLFDCLLFSCYVWFCDIFMNLSLFLVLFL